MRVVRFLSESVGQEFRLRVNAHSMRTVEKLGGIDEYMLKVSDDVLSDNAKVIRRKIIDKRNEAN
jgi:large subunit ribosomal protein L28